jgi:hypothetical protein
MYRLAKTSSVLPQLMVDEVYPRCRSGLEVLCSLWHASMVEYRQSTSEDHRGTDQLRQQPRSVIANGADMLRGGMKEYSARRRFSHATGLGSEVLTFLFVVQCPEPMLSCTATKRSSGISLNRLSRCGLADVCQESNACAEGRLVCASHAKT